MGSYPGKLNEMSKETIPMSLHAEMNNLIKVGMVYMGKHSEHLLVDGFAGLKEYRREAPVFSNPVSWLRTSCL